MRSTLIVLRPKHLQLRLDVGQIQERRDSEDFSQEARN